MRVECRRVNRLEHNVNVLSGYIDLTSFLGQQIMICIWDLCRGLLQGICEKSCVHRCYPLHHHHLHGETGQMGQMPPQTPLDGTDEGTLGAYTIKTNVVSFYDQES